MESLPREVYDRSRFKVSRRLEGNGLNNIWPSRAWPEDTLRIILFWGVSSYTYNTSELIKYSINIIFSNSMVIMVKGKNMRCFFFVIVSLVGLHYGGIYKKVYTIFLIYSINVRWSWPFIFFFLEILIFLLIPFWKWNVQCLAIFRLPRIWFNNKT